MPILYIDYKGSGTNLFDLLPVILFYIRLLNYKF